MLLDVFWGAVELDVFKCDGNMLGTSSNNIGLLALRQGNRPAVSSIFLAPSKLGHSLCGKVSMWALVCATLVYAAESEHPEHIPGQVRTHVPWSETVHVGGWSSIREKDLFEDSSVGGLHDKTVASNPIL